MRLQGLRGLARIIARRLLAASEGGGDGTDGDGDGHGRPVEGGEGLSPEEKGYVR